MNPLKANEMPHQEPLVRNKNFLEVATGYDAQTAMDEALRCLHCKHKPCISGCPVQIHIPDFIAKVAEGDFEAAYQIIRESSSLPAVCGRVCPQERQCESKCVRGIKGDAVSIGRLERFVADWHNSHCKVWPAVPEQNGHKVAVIGSGPSGLTCAGDLARLGYDVTVFEALHIAGGVLVYGIPEFRLPKKIVELEVNGLKALGVKIVTNVVIGRSMSIDDLCALPVETLAGKDCLLFLWATFPQLPEALRLIKAWGFSFKTVAFVWLKLNRKSPTWFYGLGYWTRGNAEICLLAKRGHPKRYSKSVHQFIISPVEEHSKKPDITREKIIALAGDLPRAELFARQKTPGWDAWGNELDSDFSLSVPETR